MTARDVLVIDEARMIGLRQMPLVLAAEQAGAKVVLVGDPEQLQAIAAGAALRALAERHGAAAAPGLAAERDEGAGHRAAGRGTAAECGGSDSPVEATER